MNPSDDQLQNFLASPQESLSVELKRWLDLTTPEGKAILARACLALRNSNGGQLVVGFDDVTRLPDAAGRPADVRAAFHPDLVQEVVGKFAAEPFAVEVRFIERGGEEYPVVCVPPGVRTPVAAKSELNVGGKPVIRDDAIYVRTIGANNRVSSSQARRGDWDGLVRVCFDNREADIGAFIRRQLGGADIGRVLAALAQAAPAPAPSAQARADDLLARGRARSEQAMIGRPAPPAGLREVAVVVDGEVPPRNASREFLTNLILSKPLYSGWSPWVASLNSTDESYVSEGAWESLLDLRDATLAGTLNFWRLDPRGEFYHLDTLREDTFERRGIAPGTELEFQLQTMRVIEYVTAARSFARTMGCDESLTHLACSFRWSGLRGRRLSSRADPFRDSPGYGAAQQDEVVTRVVVPLEVPPAGLARYIADATRELFLLFGGAAITDAAYEDIVQRFVGGRR